MKSLLLFTALTALASPTLSFAQTDPDTEPAELEAIIVTGTRAAGGVPADRIGGSITLLDAEALERRQTRDVSDILRDVPGLAVGRVPGQTQIRIRGAEGNHTLVLVDGIEVSDPFAGEFDFGTLVADDAARIEVLRGQQSAIYGSDAIGGVIQYITLTGREAPGIRARGEVGSFGTVNTAARIAGVSGPFDYALSATLNTSDGSPGARGGERDLGSDTGALSFKSIWSLAENARVSGVFRYARTEADFNNSDNDFDSPTFGFQADSPGSRFENEAVYGLVRGEFDALDGRWTHALTGQVADTERDVFNADERSFGNEGRRLKGSYETTLRLENGDLRHLLTAALDVERERYRNTSPPSSFAFTGRRQVDNVGIVGQYDLSIGENASFGASVRRDDNNRFADTTTYRVQGSYRFVTDTRLRAAAGSGVKNPGFYELFGFVDGRYVGNPDLKPEESQGWEVGVEQPLLDGAATLGVTYFQSTLDNEIVPTFPPPDFVTTPINLATESKQRGVEAFGRLLLGEAWRIDAAYTYLRAREDGIREVRRPTHTASVAVDWRAVADRGGLTLVARYNGQTRDNAFIDPSFVPVRVELGDYILVNLNADLKLTERVGLYGRIENLLDEDYEDVFSFETAGRSVAVGARARF